MTTDDKKIIEYNFDRMREVIQDTWLPIMDGADTVGETRLGTSDVFRLATALINEGFHLERKGEWIERVEKPEWLEDDVEIYYECSCCGIYNFGQSYYCPGCGAKMAVKETLA